MPVQRSAWRRDPAEFGRAAYDATDLDVLRAIAELRRLQLPEEMSVLVASDAFRVVIRARNFAEYEALMPASGRFAIISEALDAFAPSHLEWDVGIEIEERHARPAKLDGRARLGLTGWVKPGKSRNIRMDAHLSRRARPASQSRGEVPA